LNVNFPRTAGVQLHLTSLPGGRLGTAGREWVDWLAEAGQSWWQVLPLGPPDRHRSPYAAKSAFAVWEGFLEDPEAEVAPEEVERFREEHAFWAAGLPRKTVAHQVRFAREWGALREYAAARGVRVIGDIPIYVAPGGLDQQAWPELFVDGAVAGAPPDAFSDEGQHWGNPLYDWRRMSRTRYRWWTERFRRTFELVDVARIDHFRGFVAYWAIPEDAPTAKSGRWRRGPGRAVFDAAARELGELALIAEDLGEITPPVVKLRKDLGMPGMVVLQFAFDPDDPDGPHRPEHHGEDVAAYTGTHDTDTLAGWLATLEDERRAEVDRELAAAGLDDDDPLWGLIRLWFRSPAPLAMTQLQDVLGLGSEARMNLPGTKGRSWRFEADRALLTAETAARLRAATKEAGRLPDRDG
jgi:4-alpha-glucanotransferase